RHVDAAVRRVRHAVLGDVPVGQVHVLAVAGDLYGLLDRGVVVVRRGRVGQAVAGRRHPHDLGLAEDHVRPAVRAEVDVVPVGGRLAAVATQAHRDAVADIVAV